MFEKYPEIISQCNKIPDAVVFISKKTHFNKYPHSVNYSILVLISRDAVIDCIQKLPT